MSSLVIARPLPIVAVTCSNGSATGVQNLLTPDPKEVFYFDNSDAALGIDIDLGANPQPYDTFFLGYIVDAAAVRNLTIKTGAANPATTVRKAASTMDAPSATNYPRRQHSFYRHNATLTDRYVRFQIDHSVANAMSIGIAFVGVSVQPQWGREWGSGRLPVDMSAVTPLRGGGYGIERGARKGAFEWTHGDLTDAETDQLWLMAEECGESGPIVVAEDPDNTAGLNERLHYGLFDNPQAYSREAVGITRWAFRLKEWV